MRILFVLFATVFFKIGVSAQVHEWRPSSFDTAFKIKDVKWINKFSSFSVTDILAKNKQDLKSLAGTPNVRHSRFLSIVRNTAYMSRRIETTETIKGYINGIKYDSVPLVLKFPFDSSKKDTVRIYDNDVESKDGSSTTFIYKAIKDTVELGGKQMRKLYTQFFWQWKGNPKWYLNLSGGAQISTDMIFVNDPKFIQRSSLDSRQQSEEATFGHVASAEVGIKIGFSSYLTPSFVYLSQGFKTNNSEVNWNTGEPVANAGVSKKYYFKFIGGGLGFTHCNYTKTVSVKFDAGLLYVWLNKFGDETISNLQTTGLTNRLFIGYFGVGANINISTGFSFSIVPTEYYDITAISKGSSLLTRMNNFGVNLGLNIHPL